jgi:hypothetical protein
LPDSVRAFFEPRFGHDFSQVRIHADSRAAASAAGVNALAYTVGRDIVLAPGAYAPETTPGRRLLAHELTHTIQQGARGRDPGGQAEYLQRAGLIDEIKCGLQRAHCYSACYLKHIALRPLSPDWKSYNNCKRICCDSEYRSCLAGGSGTCHVF